MEGSGGGVERLTPWAVWDHREIAEVPRASWGGRGSGGLNQRSSRSLPAARCTGPHLHRCVQQELRISHLA